MNAVVVLDGQKGPPPRPPRHRLPDVREGKTRVIHIRFSDREGAVVVEKVYVTPGTYPDGRLGEVFLKMDKPGRLTRGLLDGISLAVSVGLQHGIPLSVFCEKYEYMQFEPSGPTEDFGEGDDERHYARSILDVVFRYLRLRYGAKEHQG